MLERHVNSHFEESSTSTNHSGPRKSIEGAPARKRLKRAGVKLKFRQLPFSARIFDFFDTGAMAGIRHAVAEVEERGEGLAVTGDRVQLSSRMVAFRTVENGERQVQLKWSPEDL